jgi:hypothetical protein
MKSEHVHDLLAAYLDGGITDPALRETIERHLEGCADCRAKRDATARAMARIGGIIRGTGNGIAVPDVRWVNGSVQRAQPYLKPDSLAAGQRPSANHDRSRPKQMKSNSLPRRDGREIGAIAGGITFALLIVMLAAAVAAFSIVNAPRNAIGPTDEGTTTATVTDSPMITATPTDSTTITATVTDSSTSTTVPATETATPSPTQAPGPMPTLESAAGGFVENAVDISGLPEYELPDTGRPGDPMAGEGCDQDDNSIPESQTVASVRNPEIKAFQLTPAHLSTMWLVCLYDIPDTTPGTKFTVRLTSPSGNVFSREYTIWDGNSIPQSPNPIMVWWYYDRDPIFIYLEFQAAQEYGDWLVEGISSDGRTFASGSVMIDAPGPVYSVSLPDDPLDPFTRPLQTFVPEQRLLFAGRGLEAGRELVLAVYIRDPDRETEDTLTMVPRFARRITVADDGTFRAEFVLEATLVGVYATYDPVPVLVGRYMFLVDPVPGRMEGVTIYVMRPEDRPQ